MNLPPPGPSNKVQWASGMATLRDLWRAILRLVQWR